MDLAQNVLEVWGGGESSLYLAAVAGRQGKELSQTALQ